MKIICLIIIGLMFISFVQGETMQTYLKPSCNNCLHNEKCYNIGTRLTIESEYKNKEMVWKNEIYLFCGMIVKSSFPKK